MSKICFVEEKKEDLTSLLLKLEAAALELLEKQALFEECLALECREVCRRRGCDERILELIDELIEKSDCVAAFNICCRLCNIPDEEVSKIIEVCEKRSRVKS